MSVQTNVAMAGGRSRHQHTGSVKAAALGASGVACLVMAGVLLAVALDRAPIPLSYALAGGIFALAALALVIGRYDVAVVSGFALSGVVIIEPAPSDVIFGLAIAVAALTGTFGIRRVPRVATSLVAAFLALNVLSLMGTISGSAAARFFLITFYLCIFSLWLAAYIDRPQRARWLVCAYLAVAVISAILGSAALFAHFPGHTLFIGDERRAKALFKDPNVYGPYLIPIALILLEEILQRRLLRLRRSSMIACFLMLMLGVLFSYSRAAWLNLVVGLIVLFGIAVLRRLDRRVITLLLVVVVGSAATVGAVIGTGSLSFLQERAKFQSYDVHRFAAQAKGLKVGLDHPFGVGPGQFDVISPISSHSLYVRALSEQGVLGLLVIAAIVLVTGWLGLRNVIEGIDTYGISAAALFAAWCGLAVNSFVVDTMHWRHLWLVAALIWAGAARRAAPSRSTSALELGRDSLAAPVG